MFGSITAVNNTGRYNTSVGDESMVNNTSGADNVAVGASSLRANTTGLRNVAIGKSALASNQGGDYNTAVGGNSMYYTTGSNNTSLGYHSMNANASGNHNTAVGFDALDAITSSDQNTALGFKSLTDLTSGSMNVGIGDYAGDNLTSGSYNIFIGSNTDAPNTTGSRQLNIGNIIYGTNVGLNTAEIGIGTDSPDEALDVRGTLQVKNSSGLGRIKIVGASGNSEVVFWNDAAYGGAFGYNIASDNLFLYHGAKSVIIKTGNVYPGTDKGSDLGLYNQAWDDIWCDDLHNVAAAAFANRIVTEEIVNHPPKEKTKGSFNDKTERGLSELDPASLPKDLHDENSILTNEVVTYNYKANYEQQLQINELKKVIEQQNKKIEQLIKLVSEK